MEENADLAVSKGIMLLYEAKQRKYSIDLKFNSIYQYQALSQPLIFRQSTKRLYLAREVKVYHSRPALRELKRREHSDFKW